MSLSLRVVDNLVIGGGLAGAMAALHLARAGREVILLEKEHAAHHKVCGEFLSREALSYLEQAGLAPREFGAAEIGMVRLSTGGKVVEAALPFTALSLSRSILDAEMLLRARRAGCDVRRGIFVEHLEAHDKQWLVRLRGGESLVAKTVFLANGKHDLRGWDRDQGRQGDLVGFKMHCQLTAAQTDALRECMELFLFSGGYGGLSLVEDDVANLCLVVRRAELRKVGAWPELVASIFSNNAHLRQIMHGSRELWERPLAISSIPYGYLAGRPDGIWCIGDQAAVIPSFTGDGMSIALHSAAMAAEMYLGGSTAEKYNRKMHAQLHRGMTLATWLSKAMVTRTGRGLAPSVLTLFPHAIRWIALATRIPERALLAGPANTDGSRPLRRVHIA